MVTFYSEKISPTVTRIHGVMDEQMYLVEGTERAALIDTGTGAGSLKKYVETLTEKPILVLITHGHLDHAMGAAEFDTIYMNRVDDYIYEDHRGLEGRRAFLAQSPGFSEIEEEDWQPSLPAERFHNLSDGDVFELGGVSVEVLSCPGHTRGSMVMLLREERSLLTGDACNMVTFMFGDYSTGIDTYEKSLLSLKAKVEGRFDRIYLSHGESDAKKELLDEVILVCRDIKEGNTAEIPFSYLGDSGVFAKAVNENLMRTDGKKGNVIYNPLRVWE